MIGSYERSNMNIQAQKAIIIKQFKQVDDVNLINTIKNMLDYALKKEKENIDIPEASIRLVSIVPSISLFLF